MKIFIQVTLTLFTVFIIHLFLYRKIFVAAVSAKLNLPPRVLSLLIAMLAGILLMRKIGNISNTLPACIIAGGITIGIIGFILGFFGPMILTPNSNQGPLLGIFFTGPAGVLLGLVVGGLYWYPKVKKK